MEKISSILIAKHEIQGLISTERVEFIVPLTYMIMLLMAYYGPNADIIGNVKLQMWHFQTPIKGNFFSKVKLSLMMSTTFELSSQNRHPIIQKLHI